MLGDPRVHPHLPHRGDVLWPRAEGESVQHVLHLLIGPLLARDLVAALERNEEVAVTREHGKGDVAFRGPSQLLLLALWRRISIDESLAAGAEVFGNRLVLDEFVAAFGV